MKTLYNTLLVMLLLMISAGAAEAQRVESGLTHPASVTAPLAEYKPTSSNTVPNEEIISFTEAKSPKEQRAYERKMLNEHGVIVKEWSASGKYALLVINKRDNHCYSISGAGGNPFSGTHGGGDQVGINYVVTGPVWSQGVSCNNAPSYDNIFDYNSDNCSDIDQLIPYLGSSPRTTARVAVIDSGVKNIGPGGTINGVYVSQVVVPESCTTTSCSSYYPSVTESSGFNSHGYYITQLITGWFQNENREGRLEINSYKVLDDNLECSVFQVIKAIELATADGNQIISLSLGFIPQPCRRADEGGYGGMGGDSPAPNFPSPGMPIFPVRSPVTPTGASKSLGRSILYDVIEAARDQGVIVVTSAGNDNANLDYSPQYPAAETGLRNIVTVGALNCNDGRAYFSNYSNTHVDLFTYGDFEMVNGGCLNNILGTSFACPLVAAKAALHVTTQKNYNMDAVLCQLRDEATPFSGAKYGIVDANAGWRFCGGAKSAPEEDEIQAREAPVEVSISPNPFNDQLTIDVPEKDALLTIIDARGSRVIQREVSQSRTTLNLNDLKPGVYWVSVHSSTGTQTKSVVKQ